MPARRRALTFVRTLGHPSPQPIHGRIGSGTLREAPTAAKVLSTGRSLDEPEPKKSSAPRVQRSAEPQNPRLPRLAAVVNLT